MFEFYLGTKIIYGIGACKKIAAVLMDNGWERVGIIVDHSLLNSSPVKNLLLAIGRVAEINVIECCAVSEPNYEYLDKIRGSFMGKNLQAMIGIGGGSSLDTTKAMAVLVNNKELAITYRGFNKMSEPVLPIIAIPTTAGTGSEVTPNASFVDFKEKKKMGINGEAVRPRYAILDPELTLSCPKSATVSSALDSIVHAVEAYVARKSNPMARLFAKEGLKYVVNSILDVIVDPQAISYRDRVMYGAMLSGIALMNSGTGPAAAMSYPTGVHYRVPHGIAGSLFLPLVIEQNIEKGFFDYADLLDCFFCARHRAGKHKEDKARQFLAKIKWLWKDLGISSIIKEYNIQSDFIQTFVKETLELRAALDQNPVPFYEEEIKKAFKSLFYN